MLTGGESYLIGGDITAPFSDVYNIPNSVVTDALITITGAARNGSSGGFSAPSTVTAGNGRFGPNFEFTVNATDPNTVPEPSALLIAFTGLGLMATFSRRRGAAAAV